MRNYSDEQIIAAINSAPEAVRDAIQSGSMAIAVAETGKKYSLHVDVVGNLAASTRNMLLGLTSPTEVLGELVAQGVSAETAKRILEELNAKIFMPLHEKVLGTGRQSIPPVKIEMAPAPQTAAPMMAPASNPMPPKAAPAFVQPSAPMPAPAPITSAPSFAPPQATAPAPRPQPSIAPTFTPPTAAPPMPRPAQPSAPENMPRPTAPSAQKPPSPATPTTPRNEELHEVLKKYGVDPYREPVE